ncbi:hypothetical protein [uncultured Desulfobacter sp.]|uniref:hypothetical protein n=1 Tax=uncultured Desulfobacter sp. TaxID=240139 RepID=UPI002AAB96F9|nr:hypothetical protein [uncultured Desulfobacter sp.]
MNEEGAFLACNSRFEDLYGAKEKDILGRTDYDFVNGELIGIQGIGRDITERKLFQEQLEHSRKLESTGRLADGVAHGFNNMLSVIIGNTELLLLDLPDNSPAKEPLEQTVRAVRPRNCTDLF